MYFEVGDIVTVHKPYDVDEDPVWIADMDELDGCVGKITDISDSRTVCCISFDEGTRSNFLFNLKWLSPWDEQSQFVLEELDINVLMKG